MEFKFNINDVFKMPVVEINQSLIPPGFEGDRRALWDTVNKVTEVVNAMGEASAAAQGLTKAITTAERLRNSEHKLYFLIDQNANNGKGAVTGMLKTGSKGLYVFDRDGQHYQVSPPCVLDFYIHESRQRTGLGKKLFEHMLENEQITPVQMAIDRPSEKFLGFLNKHYALSSPVKQMNNYVVFDGFFPKRQEEINHVETSKSGTPVKKDSANGLQTYTSPVGRYGAHRPPCSMGQIIHNQTSTINKRQEPAGRVQSMPVTNYQGNQSPQQPNPCVSQSVPNIQHRERAMIENYYPNQQHINQEGQPDGNDLQTSFQNQMRISSQQNIPGNFNQISNLTPSVNYVNMPQPSVGGLSPAHHYLDPNMNNQYMVQTNSPHTPVTTNTQQCYQNYNAEKMAPQYLPQIPTVNERINIPQSLSTNQIQNLQGTMNADNGQHVYQASDQQNINTTMQPPQYLEKPLQNEYQATQIQRNQSFNNSANPVLAQNMYQQPLNNMQTQIVHQHQQDRMIPTTTQSQFVNQMHQDQKAYQNSELPTSTPQLAPPLQTVHKIPPQTYLQKPQISNNPQRMVDGSTPEAQNHYQASIPSQTYIPQTLNNQHPMFYPPVPMTQNQGANPSQTHMPQPQTINNQQLVDGSAPMAQNQQVLSQNQVLQNPAMSFNEKQFLQPLPPNVTNNLNTSEQQSIGYNQLQRNTSVPDYQQLQSPYQQVLNNNQPAVSAMNSNDNRFQQQAMPQTNEVVSSSPLNDRVINPPNITQSIPNQLYQMRHPPLPLGQYHHQSAMDLQQKQAGIQKIRYPYNVGKNTAEVVDQNVWKQNDKQVGQVEDHIQQKTNSTPVDTQRAVSQSYSVPNVYGNFQNTQQNVRRGDLVKPVANGPNAREVTEEGVLKYGYPVQMTKSQVFAQANIIRQPAS
nr:mediator of RNA polymerase II transcription subunit 15-like [Leptinotarsa decemlineata]